MDPKSVLLGLREKSVGLSKAQTRIPWREIITADGYVLQISNERLANLIEKLSQPEQRLLILRFVLELNDREIGRMMRCSRSAIQRRCTSVLRNLRKQLTGELL